jgi:AcrR family transcriptional regulator
MLGTMNDATPPHRPTSTDGRGRIRRALVDAGARELYRHGYRALDLDVVAREAGYSLETVHHVFVNKEALALAIVQAMEDDWYDEVGYLFDQETDPVETLVAVAGGTAVFGRHDPLVLTALGAEFDGVDHPVGRAVTSALSRMFDDILGLIRAGRKTGAIPPGPPPQPLAAAYLGALAGVVNQLDGQAPFDTLLAEKAALGVLGLAPPLGRTGT